MDENCTAERWLEEPILGVTGLKKKDSQNRGWTVDQADGDWNSWENLTLLIDAYSYITHSKKYVIHKRQIHSDL